MTNEIITVKNLRVAYDNFVLFDDINFGVNEKDIFIIMGASGCGKSSMLRVLTGLVTPVRGDVLIDGKNFSGADTLEKTEIMKNCGVMYQGGALFSSMTLKQNVAMPLELYSNYTQKEINEIASYKLALTGLGGFDDFYPSEISGGMKKRAALSRALALDPKILYCDEPSAGLDPISSKRLDDLISWIIENSFDILLLSQTVKEIDKLRNPDNLDVLIDFLIYYNMDQMINKLLYHQLQIR